MRLKLLQNLQSSSRLPAATGASHVAVVQFLGFQGAKDS